MLVVKTFSIKASTVTILANWEVVPVLAFNDLLDGLGSADLVRLAQAQLTEEALANKVSARDYIRFSAVLDRAAAKLFVGGN